MIKRKSGVGRGGGKGKKIELYGVKKLRELILELAVRGLLVPQDSNDEPASVLLEKVSVEKAELIKEGKIKKQKALPAIRSEEKPHALPVGWSIEKFGNLATIERGGSPRPIKSFLTDSEEGFNWIKIGDTDIGGKYISSTQEKITKDGLKKTRMVYPGDFLLTNSMSFGRPYITKIEGCIHDGWLRISPTKYMEKDFLYWLLSSPYIVKKFKASASGAVVQNLNSEKVKGVVILLPPLNEQHRIVAKVDELMTLCDQLEQQTEANISAHQALVETLLAAITRSDSSTGTNPAESIELLFANFDSLFTTEDSIDQLKQAILQLAVMGKLVPQDPTDEPASVLLEKIAAEKEKLVKEKKIKKQKGLPPIGDEEVVFDLPRGWSVERLGNLVSRLGSGSTPRGGKNAYVDDGVPFLRSQNVWNGGLSLDDVAYISEETHDKMENTKVFPKDVLLNITGASLGRTTIFPEELIEANVSQHVTIIRLLCPEMASFVHLGILSPMVQRLVWGRQVGMAIGGLSKKVLEMFEFPVPPLAEQHRIVSRVDELMTLCDQLKVQLNTAQTTQLHLADAVTEQAIA